MKTYGKAVYKYGTPACFAWAIVESLNLAREQNKTEIIDEADDVVGVILSQEKTKDSGQVTLLGTTTGGPAASPGSEWPEGGWLTINIDESHTINIIIESTELAFSKSAAATYSFTGYAYPKITKGE